MKYSYGLKCIKPEGCGCSEHALRRRNRKIISDMTFLMHNFENLMKGIKAEKEVFRSIGIPSPLEFFSAAISNIRCQYDSIRQIVAMGRDSYRDCMIERCLDKL